MIERELRERALAEAREELGAFLAEIDDDRLLERLKAERPLHPLLWMYRSGLFFMSMLVALCLASMVAPLLHPDFARLFARYDAVTPIPLPLIPFFLGYSAGAIGISARWFAVQRARRSPMLPGEQRRYDVLSSSVRAAERMVREADQEASRSA